MKRVLLILAGSFSLGLGILGIALPGLPTTPFVLLAAGCFAKASPALHSQLVGNRFFGPMIRDWERHHSLPVRVKCLSTAMMLLMIGFSIWQLAAEPWLQLAILTLGLIGVVVVWRIPTRQSSS